MFLQKNYKKKLIFLFILNIVILKAVNLVLSPSCHSRAGGNPSFHTNLNSALTPTLSQRERGQKKNT